MILFPRAFAIPGIRPLCSWHRPLFLTLFFSRSFFFLNCGLADYAPGGGRYFFHSGFGTVSLNADGRRVSRGKPPSAPRVKDFFFPWRISLFLLIKLSLFFLLASFFLCAVPIERDLLFSSLGEGSHISSQPTFATNRFSVAARHSVSFFL